MKTKLTLVLAVTLINALSPVFGQWERQNIDENISYTCFVDVDDMDNDGDMDIVVSEYGANMIRLYENDSLKWTMHDIAYLNGVVGLDIADFDNDGKQDVVKAAANLSRVVLFKNNLPDENWTEIIIDNSMYGTFMANIGDIDNDGDMDIVAAAQGATGSLADVAWYENDGNEQTWTKHTVCTDLLKARCLYIVDIDNNGYMDIVVSDLDADDIILFINENGGQNWTKFIIDDNYSDPNPVFAYDIDLDGDFDIFPTSRVDNAFVWYENSLDPAYAYSLEVYPLFVQPPGDTLTVRASMRNPDNHTVNVSAIIQGLQCAFTDTIQLYDDGLHGDGDSSDNMWCNKKMSPGLPEDIYIVKLFTYDLHLGTVQYCHRPERFTTIGPVIVEGYTFIGNDTEPNAGDRMKLELTLRNNDSNSTATNIKARLISLDTLVSTYDYSRAFGNIEAGENSTSDNTYILNIAEEYPVNTQIPIQIDIASNGYKFWIDTLYVLVDGWTRIEDLGEQITRIYPNPTNDILNIEMNNTGKQVLEIEIFSITGTLIYKKEYRNINAHFVEKLNLSAHKKGVYLIKVRQDDEIYVKKVVVR
jgi:hypothetical protein